MKKKNEIKEEYVLVFPVKILDHLGKFQGFTTNAMKYFEFILKKENTQFLKREIVENDPQYKQIIPYVILKYKETYFTYQRGKLQTEKRLLDNYSLGIGGHISIFDENLFSTTYEEGLNREINEEIYINSKYTNNIIGLINDDTNDVGKVHFGVVHLFELERKDVQAKEKSIRNVNFMSKEDLTKKSRLFETWSQIIIKYLTSQIPQIS